MNQTSPLRNDQHRTQTRPAKCPATRRAAIIWTFLSCVLVCLGQETKFLYQNDFEKATLDKVPEDLLILDGTFSVQEENGNKFLQLPGAPLETFGFIFGTTEKDGCVASARVYGTSRGRRFPTFALGLNGVGGYRLQVSPAKKAIELFHGDTAQESAPFQWTSGKWTHLRLEVLKTNAGWTIHGKAWIEGQPEPSGWMISAEEKGDLPPGRALLFGSPFAETPIRFDDLAVQTSPKSDTRNPK